MASRKPILTPNELEIMQIVWRSESVTVRDVYEDLRERRKIAYTTVMTMMGILEEKGHLTRVKQGRAYLYEPVRPKSQVIAGMVDDFVERKHGRKKVEYLVPELEPILKETYGVIVYQEQVMKIAGELAAYTMAEADDLSAAGQCGNNVVPFLWPKAGNIITAGNLLPRATREF